MSPQRTPMITLLMSLLLGLSLSAQETPKGAAATGITDAGDVLKGIPRDVMKDLRYGTRTMADAASKATLVTRKNVESKSGTFKVALRTVEKFQRREAPDVTRYRLVATVDSLRESGVSLNLHIMAVLDVADNDKAAKLGPGDKVTVTGKISNAEILARQTAELHIDLMDAKLK